MFSDPRSGIVERTERDSWSAKLRSRLVVRLTRWLEAYKQQLQEQEKQVLITRLAECGTDVRLNGCITFWGPENARIGNNVHLNDNSFIDARGGLVIGDNTHIARNLVLFTTNHNYEGICLPYDNSLLEKEVVIGRNVWIGMNVCIAPGTRIGDGAIVGIGVTVFGDVPPFAIIGAAPWRVLKSRDTNHYNELETEKKYGGFNGHPLWLRDEK